MRNELYTHKTGKPVNNNVLVEVTDHFDQIKTSTGLYLPNMSHEESKGPSPGYSFQEFVIRHGTVISVPDIITSGSFDYNTECELKPGDIVYWNYFSFLNHQPLVMKERKFVLADYHECIFRIRDDKITPINGNVLLSPVKEEHIYGEYSNTLEKTNKWVIHTLPERLNDELNPRNYTDNIWEVGDEVYITVMDKPFEIEGDIVQNLDEKLYACFLRMILCTTT